MVLHLEGIMNLIKEVDQFGAVFKPSIKLKDQQYKTFFGGLFSIMIYGTSLGYFIYGIYQWQTGQMLPNIVIDEQLIDSIYFTTGTDKIFLFEPKRNMKLLYPFNKTQIVMMALLHQFLDGEMTGNYSRITIEDDGSLLINNLELAYNYPINGANRDQQFYIVMTSCQQTLLDIDEKCADNDILTQFWLQDNFLSIEINTKQYNTQGRNLNNISRQFFVLYNQKETYYNQMAVSTTLTIVDEGILFPSTSQLHYVSQVDQNSQSIDIKSFTIQFGVPAYVVIALELDNLKILQYINFPSISIVLANIGSIVSLVLFLSFIAIQINQKSLEKDAIRDVIQLYFPQFKDFTIVKNWRGKIISVTQQSQIYDIKQFEEYYQRLVDIAQQKLCFLNQIYEISRQQFGIQKIIDRDELIKVRDVFLKMSLKPNETMKSDISQKQPSNISIAPDMQEIDLKVQESSLDFHRIQNDTIDRGQDQNQNYDQIRQISDIDNGQIQHIQVIQLQTENNEEQIYEENNFNLFCMDRIEINQVTKI
ncbi:hypothetical protein pb186bvf_011099 [Paramecium bursaria]